MKQLLQFTVEVECERGDDATTTARHFVNDSWDRPIVYNERAVILRDASFRAELAR